MFRESIATSRAPWSRKYSAALAVITALIALTTYFVLFAPYCVAIDDFGTEYSSLSRLKSLPIDVLKIDRNFIRNIPQGDDERAIAAAIISLGHDLGLRVVAEGVETAAQLDFLRAQGCDAAQGFLICRPISSVDVTRFLVEQSGTNAA